MNTHLSRGKINIGLIQERARKEFLDLLDKYEGSKVIVWDDGLAGPFGLIAEYSLLKKRDVTKMHPLKPDMKLQDAENFIFITRPQLKLMDCVIEIIRRGENPRKKKKWHLFCVPMRSLLCEEHLKNKGVFGSLTSIEEIPGCLLFPFDSDLMSMEINLAFKDYYIDEDPSCLYQATQALFMLQDFFGPIKRISGKGTGAAHVMKLFTNALKTSQSNTSSKYHSGSQIDQVILLDRNIDLISAVATQLTYAGLIDELWGISNCTVKLPGNRFSQPEHLTEEIRYKQMVLNSADEVFSEICDKNFFTIGHSLSHRAKRIANQIDQKNKELTVEEIRQFVEKMPQLLAMKKGLADHMAIAEMIKEVTDTENFRECIQIEQEIILGLITDRVLPYIEDCMAHKVDIVKVLRLICMQSIVRCGLKPKVLEQYKRDILQTYGFEHILTLTNLEKVGLLKIQQESQSFTVLRKMLKLVTNDTNFTTPKDIHFVYGIYAPLSVRLAQQFVKPNGIRIINDVVNLLPGPLFDHPLGQTNIGFGERRNSISSQSDSAKVVLVFFLGGCTYAEISALRFLSQQEDLNTEFVIATTKIINGNSFVKSISENLLK